MDKVKIMVIAVMSAFMSWLGILALPVLLLVTCNLIDYFTSLCAAKYRTEGISSYKGICGIVKRSAVAADRGRGRGGHLAQLWGRLHRTGNHNPLYRGYGGGSVADRQ